MFDIAGPAMIANLTTPLIGIVATTAIGRLGAPAMLGGVAMASVIFDCLFWLFAFLRASTLAFTAQSLGAALYEEIVIDETGRVINPRFRDYHLPSYADVPRTEVLFAETTDTIGPLGAKSMSESPYNPVSAALGNALRAATGIRFTATPFKPDRLFPLLQEKFGA
ncbi:MAG: molybdopterin cofactor-binding domain-containing protein [Bradyrhizobium sp.]|nr:molybdopterin cofactor-binding domain-containing protein [Bradyrhizobium sp.]